MANSHAGPLLNKLRNKLAKKKRKPANYNKTKKISVKNTTGRPLTKIEQLELLIFSAQQTIILKDPTLKYDEAYNKAEEWIKQKIAAGSITLN